MAIRKENTQNNNPAEERSSAIPDITVRIYPVTQSGSKLRANAQVTIAGAFAVRGFRIFDSEKGLFVKEPQRSYVKQGTELDQSVFFPVTREAREKLYGQILDSYRITMEQNHAGMEDEETFEEIDPEEDLPFEQAPPEPEEEPAMQMGM